jgi:light-regulated signal transduction histidine kinase (bacteriophytochrome)
VKDLRDADPERAVDVEIEPGLVASADQRLLRVLLQNLVGNAWKFTSKQDSAKIEVGRANGDASAFVVRDDGVGFDMAYADKLFGAFQRLHSAGEFEGTGIGLATVQRIVHRHGGRVWAESEPGAGAAFYFTLPRRADDGKQDDPAG